jgi:hypothetical protein
MSFIPLNSFYQFDDVLYSIPDIECTVGNETKPLPLPERALREVVIYSVISPASTFEFPASPLKSPTIDSSRAFKKVEWNRVVRFRVIPGFRDYSREEWDLLWWSRDELLHIKSRESHRRALVRNLTKVRLMFDLEED